MGLFARLKSAQAYWKQHLHFLHGSEDLELLVEIGFHQERGQPLSMKQLYLANGASVATVQRRLQRLRAAGAIDCGRTERDARLAELRVNPRVVKLLRRFGDLHAPEAGATKES
ncbi:MAG TPA: hypothetical protein VF226_04160 [Hyphomicrobiaceae bacterium]